MQTLFLCLMQTLFLCLLLLFPLSVASAASSTASTPFQPCDRVPRAPLNRRACNLFVWDAPSALFYRWCHHLLKDHLIEGKGGHMYVRFESNSILQLLYPCSRYSPNKCLLCGGSYTDHLELWWSKNLYTPFDRHIDNTYNAALTVPEPQSVPRAAIPKSKSLSMGTKGGRPKAKYPTIVDPPTFSFHKEYVQDVSDIIREEKDQKKLRQKVMKKYALRHRGKTLDGWAIRSFPRFGVGYLLPAVSQPGDKGAPSLGFQIVRSIVLRTFNEFVYMQEIENEKANEGS